MYFFLQEKNNTDRASFYTPQIISDMITQSVCDNLDDSDVLFGKDRTAGRSVEGTGRETGDIKIPAGPAVSVRILITPSAEPSGKNFSSVLYSHKELYSAAHILSSALYDFGKIVAFDHEERRPRLIKQLQPTITILPFNLYSTHLLDHLRHIKMLSDSISDCLQEML